METRDERLERYRQERNEARRQLARGGNRETEDRLRRERNEARAQIAGGAGQDLTAYKAEVKRVAKEVAAEQGWCQDGLNQRLRELGIDPVGNDFTQVQVVVLVDIPELEGDDATAAAERRVARVLRRAERDQQVLIHNGQVQGSDLV